MSAPRTVRSILRERPEAAIIVSLFALLATIYSLVTPIFEASDEISHYPVIQHIATTGRLPVQQPGVETLWEQEGSQPPLYYLLSVGLTFWIDTSDLEDIRWRNPHAKLGIPLDPDNKNMVIHTDAEAFPWHGTVLAVHLIRFFSIILGTATVILIYRLARTIWPEARWVAALAAALAAFNPMFLFISGSVNNDNLTILLSTWTLLLCVRIIQSGFTRTRAVTLAVVLALATITKISGLTLLPLVGLVLAIRAWRANEWRQAIYTGLGIGAAWLLLGSWWYIRNIMLYGELLGLNTHVAIAGGREIGLWALLQREWYGFWVSYWALFGAVNILADRVVYHFYALLAALTAAGLGWWVYRQIRTRSWEEMLLPGLLGMQVVVVLVGVIRWTMTTYASQGRLMFPAIGALSALSALGLLSGLPEKLRAGAFGVVSAPLLLIAVIAPFRYIRPTYTPPTPLAAVPERANPVNAFFGDLELVAIETESVTVEEGGRIPITLYWRATRPIEEGYSIYLHALGRGAEEIGKIDTLPGAGLLATTQMEPGAIIPDSYSLELDSSFEAPTRLRVLIGAWIPETDEIIHPTNAAGEDLGSIIAEAGVAYPGDAAQCASTSGDPPIAQIGGFAALSANYADRSTSPGEAVELHVTWDRIGETPADWTVFVHVVDEEGQLAAQADHQPLGGDYPTSLWRRPCPVEDTFTLQLPDNLPAGEYDILLGMYDASQADYPRAPASNMDGEPLPNAAIPLGRIEVRAR
jgi:4-amino-4-deoxy-L-arabinose transferase-like glycosyltransferase